MNHLAIIPDGNRRWAKLHKLQSFFGHKKGMEAVRSAVSVCIKNSIKFLSFYTFSLENQNRPVEEKKYLFSLLSNEFMNYLPELIEKRVRVRFLGNKKLFPENIVPTIHHVEAETNECDALQLNLLFFYGAQQELTEGVQNIVKQVQSGVITPEEITPATIKSSLWTSGIPDPELIIRTGNVARLSNFLLYQAAYSEFMFIDKFWPEANEALLQQCLDKFTGIKRNFGH